MKMTVDFKRAGLTINLPAHWTKEECEAFARGMNEMREIEQQWEREEAAEMLASLKSLTSRGAVDS